MTVERRRSCGTFDAPSTHRVLDYPTRAAVIAFRVYMLVPFLWEIRAIMDWTVERTSLDLASYLQLEDIYTGLCLVRARLYMRRFRKGKTQPVNVKVFQGCGFVLALLVLTIGPLYLFSSANPFYSSNLVVIASMEVRISAAASQTDFLGGAPGHSDYLEASPGGYYPLGTISRSRVFGTPSEVLDTEYKFFDCRSAQNAADIRRSCGYKYLIGSRSGADFQTIQFPVTTDSAWTINDHTLGHLRHALDVANSTWHDALARGTTNVQTTESTTSSLPRYPECGSLVRVPTAEGAVQLEVEVRWSREVCL